MPIFRGRQTEHDFLGYYQARPTFEEARQAAGSGDYATGHELVGYAKVRIEALQVVAIEPEDEPVVDDEVPEEVAAE
jgi:hypothetical protein